MSSILPDLSSRAVLQRLFSIALLVGLQPLAQAQMPATASATAPVPKAAASASKAMLPVASKPSWAELNPMQQQSLKPLAATWSGVSEAQKRKWLEISRNYPNLPAADQVVMHSRMNEWVGMTPQQRTAARLNFAKAKELSTELTPDEKKAKWQTYQALSAEEKAKLAAKGTPKPVGAAIAVKPVAPQKLAVTPKGVLPLPNAPSAAPATTKTGDTLQNVVTPSSLK